ncbi:Methyltransferase domain protein [anaerobic digester metagenome]
MINHIKNVLNNPFVYSRAMRFLGSDRVMRIVVNDYIKPLSGDSILDMGCGPAIILDYLPDDVQYTGIDYNCDYIQSARNKFGSRGEFFLGDVSEHKDYSLKGRFDIVIATGVIHHLSNDNVLKLLTTSYDCLRKDGRFISVDNVYDKKLSILNKLALKCDRGAFIRNKVEHLKLFSEYSDVKCRIEKSLLIIPYYYVICEFRKV